MTRWNDRYSQHPFFQTLVQTEDQIKGMESSGLEVDIQLEIGRLTKVIAFTKDILDASDPELVPQSALDNLNTTLGNIKNEITNFIANKNVGHLHNANQNADQLIQNVLGVPSAIKQGAKPFLKATEAYQKTLGEYLEKTKGVTDKFAQDLTQRVAAFEVTFAEINKKLEEQNNEGNKLSGELKTLKQNVDSELATFRQKVETDQATLRQGIEAEQAALRKGTEVEQTALRQKLEEVSTGFQTKYTEQQELRSKDFSQKIQDLQQQTDHRVAEEVKASETVMSVLEKYEEQAKQVLGTVISTSQAGVYKLDAIEEGKAKRFFRGWASAFMLFAVAILVGPTLFEIFMKGAPNISLDWHDWLGRLPISIVLFFPAMYFARESSRHRNSERKSKRLEQILSTIDPYLELIDGKRGDSLKNELKATLAERIFDPNDGNALVGEDEVKSMAPIIANIIAAIRGGNKTH